MKRQGRFFADDPTLPFGQQHSGAQVGSFFELKIRRPVILQENGQYHLRFMSELMHPAPLGMTLYYWPCSLLLLAKSLMLDRPTGPLAATLRIACAEPYMIDVGGKRLHTRASLVAPKAPRKRIAALNSEVALFYLPLEMPEYAGVRAMIEGQDILELDIKRFEPVLPTLRKAMRQVLPAHEIHDILRQVIEILTDQPFDPPKTDSRVQRAIEILDEMPLDEVTLNSVAAQVNLSPSRLREIFREHTGFTIPDYARWRAVWRASLFWKRGLTITEVAHQAGFHDLAHADRAFNAVFGMNPSKVIDPKYVTLVDCSASSLINDETPPKD